MVRKLEIQILKFLGVFDHGLSIKSPKIGIYLPFERRSLHRGLNVDLICPLGKMYNPQNKIIEMYIVFKGWHVEKVEIRRLKKSGRVIFMKFYFK